VASSGKYIVSGDWNIESGNIPGSYSTSEFNQVVFVNGNLTVSDDLSVEANSAALFVVNGDVSISENVTVLRVGVIADGDFYTAYNAEENKWTDTLELNGVFQANKFHFQRTLQGTNNSDTPSEIFTYEPKYAIQLKSYFGKYGVKWISTE
jgi:hypothetical protein